MLIFQVIRIVTIKENFIRKGKQKNRFAKSNNDNNKRSGEKTVSVFLLLCVISKRRRRIKVPREVKDHENAEVSLRVKSSEA